MTRTGIYNKPPGFNLRKSAPYTDNTSMKTEIIQSLTDDLESHAKQTEDGVKFFWPAISCACLLYRLTAQQRGYTKIFNR